MKNFYLILALCELTIAERDQFLYAYEYFLIYHIKFQLPAGSCDNSFFYDRLNEIK